MARGWKIALGIVAGVLLIFILPIVLFGASNLGAGLLSLTLERRPSMQEMTGTYQFHGAGQPATMILKADRTFIEDAKSNDGIAHTVEGHWNYQYEENYASITFMPFRNPEEDSTESNGFRTACFKPRFGTTRIVINSDLGDEFRKMSD